MKLKKTVLLILCALLTLVSVPLTGALAASALTVPAGNTPLINEDFDGTYTDSATLTGPAAATGLTIAGFTSVMNSSNVSADSISLVQDATLNSKVLKYSVNGANNSQFVGVKKDFSSTGLVQGQVTVEFDFNFSDRTKGSPLFQVLDAGGKVVVDIQNKNGPALISGCSGSGATLGWYSGTAYCPIGSLGTTNNVWFHLKAVLDLNNAKGSYYLSTTAAKSTVIGQLLDYPFKNISTDAANPTLYKTVYFAGKSGSAAWSLLMDNIQVYQLMATPDAPAVTTSAGDGQAWLWWPAANNALTYDVVRSDSASGPFTSLTGGAGFTTPPTQVSPYKDKGLTNGTTYYYKVLSQNSYGSAESSVLAITPTNATPAPQAPTGFTGTVRDSAVTLNWNLVPSASQYTLKRSTSADMSSAVVLSSTLPYTQTTYYDTGLTDGTTYYYTISSSGVGGDGADSAPLALLPSVPLAAPANVNSAASDGTVSLTWDSMSGVTYSVKRSTVNGGPYTTLQSGLTAASFTDHSVTNGTAYYYVVTASNSTIESMISRQTKATPYAPVPGAPLTPSGVTGTAYDGSVTLKWDATAGAASYTVKRGTTSGGPYATMFTTTDTSFTDTGVTNGSTYYYVVSAVNTSGESPNAEETILVPAHVIVVAQDGSGQYSSIQQAVNQVPTNNAQRIVIYIKPGTYTEKVTVDRPFISFVGAGNSVTTIVYGDYGGPNGQSGNVGSTFKSPTVTVTGDNFTASNLTIQNNAGPRSTVGTAVALSVTSDKASFENMRILGYQDTLYTGGSASKSIRQYYHNSVIQGDVDFIFGEASAVVFDSNTLVLATQSTSTSIGGHLTAAAQFNPTDPGYVFMNNRIVDSTVSGTAPIGSFDLGRPWKNYSNVSFINTSMDTTHFIAAGWAASCASSSSCIANNLREYNSTGAGAGPSTRLYDSIIKSQQMTGPEASALTIPVVLGGWDPTLSVIMPNPGAAQLPVITPSAGTFDLKPANQADLAVTVQANGDTLTGITNGAYTLGASDYSLAGNVYTIKKSYLAQLPVGTTTLVFKFASNVSLPLTVTVVDSADLGKQVLAANDGWASYNGGTTGGSSAASANIYTVTNRSQLIAALGGNNATNGSNTTPRIVYINGTINLNVDDNNNPMGLAEYSQGTGYDFNTYLQTYDPNGSWGRTQVPSGAQETARVNAQKNQGARIKINVGSNVTIVGLGSDAKLVGGNLILTNNKNVIIRNIEFQDAYDYFPQWDPTDGSTGNWNSQYDNISLSGATNIWIDHNTFNDGSHPDDPNEAYYGRHYQHHDGLVDITKKSDLVTLSYNHFSGHDKTSLIGSSDSSTTDSGFLRVTIHHNYYDNITQRAPRVRYGQVHVYNNYYNAPSGLYGIGVGAAAQIYSESNYFENIATPVTPAGNLDSYSPGFIKDVGSNFVGSGTPVWRPNVNWTPSSFYTYTADSAAGVKSTVLANAGSGGRALIAPVVPAAPSGLTAAAGDSQTRLNWNAVSGASTYNLKMATTAGGPYSVVASNVADTSYTLTGLTNGTTYYFVLSEVTGGVESGVSSEVSVVPALPAPSAPTGLAATAGNAQVVLNWTAVSGATGYKVKRSSTSGGPYTLLASVFGTGYVDTTAVNGTTYYYVVTALNVSAESASSQQASATPVAIIVPVTSVSVVGAGGVSGITVKGGTLQMQVVVLPGNATNSSVTWNVYESDGVTPTDKASVTAGGLLTAQKDGVVKVVAASTDGSAVQGSKYVVLSGQSAVSGSTLLTTLTGPSTVTPGAVFTTSFGLNNVTGSVYALDLTLSFGTDAIDFMSIDSIRPGFSVLQIKTEVPGQLRVIAAGTLTGSGDVFSLHWLARSVAQPQTASLVVTTVTASNGAGVMSVAPSAETIQVAAAPADKSSLQALISVAQTQHDAAFEGTGIGQYKAGSKAALLTAITLANSVLNDSAASQTAINNAANALNQALQTFNASVNTAHSSGDLNGDGKVDIYDLGKLAANYGKTSASTDWNDLKYADFNNDGKLDIVDLVAIAKLIIN
ncbi:pectinesterase family protein [Paenibacillus cremeus]|uniref:Probable pectate lyase C n=1 Tax=Paenibacillus cremeus TaxID=2163881 RepID=A0A559K0A4_9BACL|nr:pectinesterase family protein [Paenibacillus cremeus]TVY05563.1 hypothetical protein FPZ49_29710 [Paenibacillus cremeus]